MFAVLMLLLVCWAGLWFGFAVLHLIFKAVFGVVGMLFGLLIGGFVSLIVGLAMMFSFGLAAIVLLPIACALALPFALPILLLWWLLRPRAVRPVVITAR